MKTKTRQNKPLTVKSTKENNAGLSLLQLSVLFKTFGNSYKYYNEFSTTHLSNNHK